MVDPVLQYLRGLPTGKLTPVQARLLLKGKYEEIYGIRSHNEDDPENPYPFLAVNPLEDLSKCRPVYGRMEDFIDNRVATLTGMSLTEFLELPRHLVEKILELCGKVNQKENAATQNLSDSFDNLSRSLSKDSGSNKQIHIPNYVKGKR